MVGNMAKQCLVCRLFSMAPWTATTPGGSRSAACLSWTTEYDLECAKTLLRMASWCEQPLAELVGDLFVRANHED